MQAPVQDLELISAEFLTPVQDRDQDLFLDIAAEEGLGLGHLNDHTGVQNQGKSFLLSISMHWAINV